MTNLISRVRTSIEWRLPAMVCGLLLLVTAALASSAYFRVRSLAEAAAAERLEAITSSVSKQNGQQQMQAAQQLRAMARATPVEMYLRAPPSARTPAAWDAVRQSIRGDSSIIADELWDIDGQTVVTSNPDATTFVTPGTREDVRTAASGRDSAAVGRLAGERDTIIYPVVAIVARNGLRLGYLAQWHRIKSSPTVRAQVATVFGSDAAFFIGSIPGIWTDQARVVKAPPLDTLALGKPFTYVRAREGKRFAVADRMLGSPWFVVLEYSNAAILGPASRFLRQIAVIAFVVLALALAGAWLVSRGITVPLRLLTSVVARRATGEYAARVPVRGDHELSRLASAFNGMADRVDVEVEIRRQSEEQWRLLFRANPHPMWVFDRDTLRFLAVNDAAVAKYGYSPDEFMAMTIDEIRPAEEADRLRKEATAGGDDAKADGLWRHRSKDGTLIAVQIDTSSLLFDGRPARLVLAQDVTERRLLEQQLRQSQRMEAVGRLAGGVAHDFNNLLLVIMMYTQMLHDRTPDSDPSKAELASVLSAADRAQTLTRQLLALSRQQVLQAIVLDPNETLRNVERLLRRVIGEDVSVRTQLADDVGSVLADPGQLEQVLLNLAVNARDAMPSGGRLTIATTSVDLDDAGAALHGVTQAGQYVVISVTDTGVGMAPDVRARIFDPFFTTKEVGKGTGLGLAIVYGIVTQSGGAITVYSEPGMGTTFRLYLPRVDARVPAPSAHVAPVPVAGTEVLLVVEDEPAVRVATKRALEHLGYFVLVASGGAEALELASRYVGELDLVISDVVMPEMDGPTLVARLREARPQLKALLVSGYSSDAVATRGFAGESSLFLQKPFSLLVLSQRVREALDGMVSATG